MEDLDEPRTVKGAAQTIIEQLMALGMQSDQPVLYQSERLSSYQVAFDRLQSKDLVYPCGCTRQEIADSVRAYQMSQATQATHVINRIEEATSQFNMIGAEAGSSPTLASPKPYPGTCRHGLAADRTARAWRFTVPNHIVTFNDRWCGEQSQKVCDEVGDFVLRRADGIWSYQLAVVVDDAFQGVTDVVRGQDLLDSTARQRLLAQALGYKVANTLHVPLLYDEFGLKLSKQNHAQALSLVQPLECLTSAWVSLGFAPFAVNNVATFWCEATRIWRNRFFKA
jgi:glutamyl-Q tRNA(Asp) synthetase